MPIVDVAFLPPVASRVLRRAPSHATSGPCREGWYLLDQQSETILVLDPDGNEIDRLPAPPGADRIRRPLAIDARSRLVVATGIAASVLLQDGGPTIELAHAPWCGFCGGAVAFDGARDVADRVWVVVPSAAPTGLTRQPPSGVVNLIDASSGAVLDALDLEDGHPESYTMLTAPGHGVLLNGAYGQDGSTTWLLRTEGSTIEARDLGVGGVVASVDPDRAEVLLMPHDDEDVEVCTYDGTVVARYPGADLWGTWDEQQELMDEGDEPDGYGYSGAFLDADRVAVLTRTDQVLVLDRSSGRPLGRLFVDGEAADCNEIRRIGPGRLLADGASSELIAVEPT